MRLKDTGKGDRTSDNNPPPHPTSRTSSPSNGVELRRAEVPSPTWISCSFCLINSILTGFILCSIANSPRSFHHWDDSLEKSSISDESTVLTLVAILLMPDRREAARRGRGARRAVLWKAILGESIGRFLAVTVACGTIVSQDGHLTTPHHYKSSIPPSPSHHYHHHHLSLP